MKLDEFRFHGQQFKGSLVKRVFRIFLLCTLMPLCVLAYFSLSHVSKELERQAEERLHQDCKSAGITVLERLMFLETDLRTVTDELNRNPHPDLESAVKHLGDRYEGRFAFMSLSKPGGESVDSLGDPLPQPELDGDQKAHLQAAKTLVVVIPKPPASSRILMARAVDPSDFSAGILFASILPDYLWGSDVLLNPATEFLAYHPESNSALFFSGSGEPPSAELEAAMIECPSSGQFRYECQGETYVAGYWKLFAKHRFLSVWIMTQGQLRADILEPLSIFKKTFLGVLVLSFLIVLLFSIHQIRKNLVPVEVLQKATQKISAKDFSGRVDIRSGDEFESLGEAFNLMSKSMEEYDHVMKTMIQIGVALSGEQELNRFFEIVLRGAKSIVRADGASLYMLSEDGQLILSLRQVDSLDDQLEEDSGPLGSYHVLARCFCSKTVANLAATRGETINLRNVYDEKGDDFTEIQEFDEQFGYRTRSILSVPLKDHDGRILGVLELFNAIDKESGDITGFAEENISLVESLASQAAVALTKNRLVDEFKRLFESLIELIAKAIDEKSTFTGGHCRRVPILTKMIAEAASDEEEGPLKDFSMSDEEFYELKVAALLHDCGKVVTPVHIIDKMKKLETITDRMEMVETRFNILKRDMQIAALQQGDAAAHEGELPRWEKEAEEDLAFLKKCNEGHEFLSKEAVDRVRDIARKYKWTDETGEEKPILSEKEVGNLTIQRGTLNEQERKIIKNHVVTTIKMLESLPYPKELMHVPELAGSHHERVDGTGYPKGLKGEQMSMGSKILCIADIFEALTAADRPYRKPKTLNEALHILGRMAEEGHIDRDLFNVFIHREVYMLYAMYHMNPSQVDEVDLSTIPGCLPEPMKVP